MINFVTTITFLFMVCRAQTLWSHSAGKSFIITYHLVGLAGHFSSIHHLNIEFAESTEITFLIMGHTTQAQIYGANIDIAYTHIRHILHCNSLSYGQIWVKLTISWGHGEGFKNSVRYN